MKGNSLEELRRFILNHHDALLLIPYYEALLQRTYSLQELLDDTDRYFYSIDYHSDEKEYYSDGKITVRLYSENPEKNFYFNSSKTEPRYEIKLYHDDRYYGYCECHSDMSDYNPCYYCCGDGCDWIAPGVYIEKIFSVLAHEFEGVERDMWELEEKWKDVMAKRKERIKQERTEIIQKQIERLKNEKKSLEDDSIEI